MNQLIGGPLDGGTVPADWSDRDAVFYTRNTDGKLNAWIYLYLRTSDGNYRLDGFMPLEEFKKKFMARGSSFENRRIS